MSTTVACAGTHAHRFPASRPQRPRTRVIPDRVDIGLDALRQDKHPGEEIN